MKPLINSLRNIDFMEEDKAVKVKLRVSAPLREIFFLRASV
jgi:hypothetical protein